jgi:cell division septation protein DedD
MKEPYQRYSAQIGFIGNFCRFESESRTACSNFGLGSVPKGVMIYIMEKKQRLFIYDRREVVTLIALGLAVAAFAFTLGVHLGKHAILSSSGDTSSEIAQVPTLQDSVPNKQELKEQSQDAQAVADDELTKNLHDEVTKSGVKLKNPRQVELPSKTRSASGGATTLKSIKEESEAEAPAPIEISQPSEIAKYTLQVGSYPSEDEAKEQVDSLKAHGLNPFLRQAQVKGLGTRYRLFVGGFATRAQAEKTGKRYANQHVIESYLVSNRAD